MSTEPLKIGNLSIGSRIILAPMAGVTDLPFRLIARKFHSGLVHTELISSQGAFFNSERTRKMYAIDRRDTPISVQLLGKDPPVMARAAKIMEDEGADIIDINMGCSVRKVLRQGSGSALLQDADRACRIIEEVAKAVQVPVTIKMRKGYRKGSRDCIPIARKAEDAGASALTIHGRTADQAFYGAADWDIIREIKEMVRIPVIGNGDIRTPEEAFHRLTEGCCDAVMVGRATIGNPWFLRDAAAFISGDRDTNPIGLEERFGTVQEHIQLSKQILGDHVAFKRIKKHLVWYGRGLPCAARMRTQVFETDSFDELETVIQIYLNFLREHGMKQRSPVPLDSDRLFTEHMKKGSRD